MSAGRLFYLTPLQEECIQLKAEHENLFSAGNITFCQQPKEINFSQKITTVE